MLARLSRLLITLPILIGVLTVKAHSDADMTQARYNFTMTLMANGNVLVAGGMTDESTIIDSVEIFLSTTDLIVAGSSLLVDRASHTATLLPDGRIFVAGGVSDDGSCGGGVAACISTEIYNPENNSWTAGPNMDVARFNHTANLLNTGKVLIAGGQFNAGNPSDVATDCDLFNPQTNLIEACAPVDTMAQGRAAHTATLLDNGRIFVAGGYVNANEYAVTTELYDPLGAAGGRWVSGPALIQKRAYHTTTTMGNQKVLIAGGYNGKEDRGNLGILETTEIYDPLTDAITPGQPMEARKMQHTATLRAQGTIQILGGLGNITTSFFNGPDTWVNGNFAGAAANSLTAGDVNPGASNLDIVLESVPLSKAVSGTVVDGEIRFSSPTTVVDNAKIEFAFGPDGGTEGELDGKLIDGGNMEFQLDVDSFTATLTFSPVEIGPDDGVVTGGALNFTPSPLNGSSVGNLLNTTSITVPLLLEFPLSHVGGNLVRIEAILDDATISVAPSDTSIGYDISATTGRANPGAISIPIVSNGEGGGVLSAPVSLTFNDVGGTITNSTSSQISSGIDPTGQSLQSITLQVHYFVDRLDLSGQTFEFDVATAVVRYMVFADQENYSPNDNTWSFGARGFTRFDHTALLLPNADIIQAGGRNCVGRPACSAFTYTASDSFAAFIPTSDNSSWNGVASLNNARSNHTSTLLPDGRVMVTGGSDGTVVHENAEVYNPDTDSWLEAGTMNVRRSHHSATLLTNGTVLVAGGFTTNSSTAATNRAEIFFPETNRFRPVEVMNTTRAFHAGLLLPEGQAMVIGGFADGAFLNNAEIYISTQQVWQPVQNTMTDARSQFTASLLQDGRVMVVGGVNAGGVLNSVEIYDPVTRTWLARAPLNTRRHSHTATMLADGRVIVIGGNDGFGEIDDAEIYDPLANTWTRTTNSPQPLGNDLSIKRLGHTTTLLPNNKLMITGGFSALGGAINETEGFDVAFTTFQMQGQMTISRGDHTTILLKSGDLLNIGGSDGITPVNNVDRRFFMSGNDVNTNGGEPRRPQLNSITPTNFQSDQAVVIRGQRFRNRTEANSGNGSQSSHYNHPRVSLQRIGANGSSVQNDSGFLLDLTSTVYHSGLNPDWSIMDDTITFRTPNTAARTPFGWYHLRVSANSQFSESLIVQVGPDKPTVTPGIPAGALVSDSSVSWTWDAPVGAFDGYNVYSGTDNIFVTTVTPSGGATDGFIQGNLPPGTSALIQVAAFNISGDGPVAVSSVPVFTPEAAISGLVGTPQSETEIFWSWNDVAIANYYEVFSSSSNIIISSPTTNSFTMTGLSTNTAEGIRVRAVTNGGEGPLTPDTTVFTLSATPIAVGYSNIAITSLRANWLPNTNPAGTEYEIDVILTNFSTAPASTNGGITDVFADVGGVPSNETVEVNVRSVNGDGVKSASTVIGSTVTLAEAPSSPRVTAIAPSDISIAWDANGNHGSTSYRVIFSSDNFVTTLSTFAQFSDDYRLLEATVGNLITGETYDFRISAFNINGFESAAVSTRAVTNSGGGPQGSVALTVDNDRLSLLNATLTSGRRIVVKVFPNTFEEDNVRIFVSTIALARTTVTCGGIDAAIKIETLPIDAQPKAPIQINLEYFPGEPNLGALSTLTMVRHEEFTNSCLPIATSIDQVNNLAITHTNHLSTFQLMQLAANGTLSSGRVYPNPFYSSRQAFATFDQFPAGARVRIFTLHGEAVFDGTTNASGVVTWRGTNKFGRKVASGIYIAVVEAGDDRKRLKVVVIR